MSEAQEDSNLRWFPRLAGGIAVEGTSMARATISAAWLVMSELYAYLEDLEGSIDAPDASVLIKVKIAELLVQIDCTLGRTAMLDEEHRLPWLLEYGLCEVINLPGAEMARLLGLFTANHATEVRRVSQLIRDLIAGFPGELVDSLQAHNQGRVLRFLRSADQACTALNCDAGFLVPLMKAL